MHTVDKKFPDLIPLSGFTNTSFNTVTIVWTYVDT